MQQQHGSGVLRALVDIGHAPTVDREDALRPGEHRRQPVRLFGHRNLAMATDSDAASAGSASTGGRKGPDQIVATAIAAGPDCPSRGARIFATACISCAMP